MAYNDSNVTNGARETQERVVPLCYMSRLCHCAMSRSWATSRWAPNLCPGAL